MKATEAFKQTIEQYVISMADSNPLFAQKASNPDKNIDDCCTYILNQVQKSEVNGFTDEEIFSMAIHYYEEADLDIGGAVECEVVVNHQVKLTDEEIAQLKQKAKDKVFSDEVTRLRTTGRIQPKIQPKAETTNDELLLAFE